jgi:hypothetical protein
MSSMPSFQYFLYLQEQKKSHWGLDLVNREGVPTQLFVLLAKHSLIDSAVCAGTLGPFLHTPSSCQDL